MSVDDPYVNVKTSNANAAVGNEEEDYEIEYEEVEEEIEVEEEEEEEVEVEEEIEEDELEEVDGDDENRGIVEESTSVNEIDHQNAEEEEAETGEELEEEELEKNDVEEKNGDIIEELTSVNQIVEVEEEVEEQVEEEVEEEEEEEVEEEEEEEEEEVDADDNSGELIKDLTPVNQLDHKKDASQVLEHQSPEEQSGLSAVLLRNSSADFRAEENAVENCAGGCEVGDLIDPRQKGDPQVHGKVIGKDFDGEASWGDNWRRTSENNGFFSGELNSRKPITDASSKVADNDLFCEKESNQIAGEDPKQVPPRVRPRSLTPDEYSDGGKRQAVMCDFFTKGLCIKGNLCRFLHVRDHATVAGQHNEGIIHVAEKKSELLDDEASSIRKNHQCKGGESPKEKSEMHEVSLDGDRCSMEMGKSSFRREFEKGDWCQYLPVDKGSLFDGMYSSSSLKSVEASLNRSFSFDMRNLENLTTSNRGSVPHGQNNSAMNFSNYKQPLPFCNSIGGTDALGTHKLPDACKEYHASRSTSFKRCSSPVSVGESDGPTKSYLLVDSQRLAELRSKLPYDWVPSVPFRPSFFVTQRLLSSSKPYDPICDSIERTGSASIPGEQVRKNADLVWEGMSELDCSSSKYPVSGQNSDAKIATKNFPKKDEFVLDAEGMDSADTPWRNRYTLKEEKLCNYEFSRDVSEDYKMSNDCDRGTRGDRPLYNVEAKVDKAAQQREAKADADLRVDGYFYKESKVYKHFHGALVEFVKELLRPTWHEGHLSKDAYKAIVKKTVDKVLVTLQPHEIPSTAESVKQHIALSQSQLSKLVEGYVDRYRKSFAP